MTDANSDNSVEDGSAIQRGGVALKTKLITEGKMTSSSIPLRRAVTLALAISGAMATGYTWADEATGAAPELEEIIVTAQKRSENIQDVPISVIAVSSQALQDAGVKDIRDLQTLTPGLTVTSEGNENITTARIRGIGTVGDNPGLESSVGIVIDGVYRPRNGVGFGDLGELEQIEILQGPQGELFGKNNDAGVITITSKRPSNTFGVTASITGGNFNDREASASITGPIGDQNAARLYVGYQKRDGYLTELTGEGPNGNTKTNDRNYYTLRGQWLFTPSSDVDLLLIADYSRRNESCCGAVIRYAGPFEPFINVANAQSAHPGINGGGIVTTSEDYTAWANQRITQEIWDKGVSAELNWNLGFGKLTSITAWRENEDYGGNDVDYTGTDLLQTPGGLANMTDFKQFSEELRLAGKAGPLSWLGGMFYSNEVLTNNQSLWTGADFQNYVSDVSSFLFGGQVPSAINPNFLSLATGKAVVYQPGVSGYADKFHQTSNSFAVFTNETWTITEGLDLTGGGRYTVETKKAASLYNSTDQGSGCQALLNSPLQGLKSLPVAVPLYDLIYGFGCFSGLIPGYSPNGGVLPTYQAATEHNLSGDIKLAYHFTDALMTYASVSSGYKAGGYNLARAANPPPGQALAIPATVPALDTHFPAEKVLSFEVGFKTEWFNKSLRVNGALFDQKYKDFQLNTFTGIQFVVTSLPDVSSKGGDLDINWATPLRGLNLSVGATYAYTNIDNFGPNLGDFVPGNGALDGAGNAIPARLNDRLSFAPLWSGAASATYTVPLTDTFGIRAVVDEHYDSSYNTGSDLDPRKLEGGYGLMDARLGFGPPDGKWALEVWSQNVLNKYFKQVAFDAPFQPGTIDLFPGNPRFWGITARVKF
jgi:iron complex outermembrane receptor protein